MHVRNLYKKDYPIKIVPFTQVKLTDNFWRLRLRTNAMVTITASFESGLAGESEETEELKQLSIYYVCMAILQKDKKNLADT